MVTSQGVVLYLVFWYAVYALAYVEGKGIGRRLIGVTGLLLSPVMVIGTALLVGMVGALLGIPYAVFWAFLDRWTPIDSWKVMRRG